MTSGEWWSQGNTFTNAIQGTRIYADASYGTFYGNNQYYAVTQDPQFNTLTGGQFSVIQVDNDGYIISNLSYNYSPLTNRFQSQTEWTYQENIDLNRFLLI